ncbi:MAG: hypothetical protein AB1Z23_08025 [Eubacteriales bacterium]
MFFILNKMLSFFISVILPLIIGYLIKSIFKVKKEKLDFLLYINIMLVLPISLILVFWKMELTRSMILLPILGFILPLVSGFLGYLFSRGKFEDPKQKGSYIVSNLLSNRGTIGGLTMYILYGELGYAYVNLIILFGSVLVYLIAYPLGNYFSSNSTNEKRTFKSIIFKRTNIPILGIFIGILLNFFGGERPIALTNIVDFLVKSMAWFSLIPVGSSIDFHGMKKHLSKVLDIGLIKFVIMPLLSAVVAYLLIPDKQMATSLIVVSATPVAINAVVVAKLTKLDENVAIAAFLFTITVYLVVLFPIITIVFS